MASLIARRALFDNPVRSQARLSPDGGYISFLAPKDGVLNLWLAPFADLDAATPITENKTRGIREHYWALTGRHVIYAQDEGADENWRVFSVDVDSGSQMDLTPFAGVQAHIVGLSAHRPSVAPIGLNDRQPEWHDLFEIHGFARPENRLSFDAITEAFLSNSLGGVFEPTGSEFEDSSVAVQAGAELVPGIAAALAARRPRGAR